MPPLPVIPDAWRVRVSWAANNRNRTGSMVLHFRSLNGWQPAAALAARLNARFHADMIRGMVVGTVPTGFRLTDLGAGTETVLLPSTWIPTVAFAGQALPQSTPCVVARPADRRAMVSRFRIPITRSAVGNNGVVNAADRTAITTAWSNFRANMLADGWEFGRPAPIPGGWAAFATVACRKELATIRPRMREVFDGVRYTP